MTQSNKPKSDSKKQQSKSAHDKDYEEDVIENEELNEEIAEEETSLEDDNKAANQELAQKIAQLQASVSVKDKEISDWKDKAYRFSADLQNLTKQHELDLQQSSKRGKKSVVQLMLPFIDAMNLSFSYIPESEDESLVKFVEALKGGFEKMISDFAASNIEFLVPTIGDIVDVEYMSVLNATGEDGDELTVARVVGVGVKIDGQLIQEATVMI